MNSVRVTGEWACYDIGFDELVPSHLRKTLRCFRKSVQGRMQISPRASSTSSSRSQPLEPSSSPIADSNTRSVLSCQDIRSCLLEPSTTFCSRFAALELCHSGAVLTAVSQMPGSRIMPRHDRLDETITEQARCILSGLMLDASIDLIV